MWNGHEKYIKRCYELAVSAGKKGFDTFGAVLVSNDDGRIIAEAENTSKRGYSVTRNLILYINARTNFPTECLRTRCSIRAVRLVRAVLWLSPRSG